MCLTTISDSATPRPLCARRLDAIGAIGISRCLTFGGKFGRVLHNPAVPPRASLTKEQYMSGEQQTTVNHFYEKVRSALLLGSKPSTSLPVCGCGTVLLRRRRCSAVSEALTQ